MKKTIFPAFIILSLAFLDLGSKYLAKKKLLIGLVYSFLPPFLQLKLVSNQGVAFSLGSSNAFIVIILSTIIFCFLILVYLRRALRGFSSKVEHLGWLILISGALGNLSERYVYGKVTDFLDFMFIDFPVFNIADVLIDVGIGLLLFSNYYSLYKVKNQSDFTKRKVVTKN